MGEFSGRKAPWFIGLTIVLSFCIALILAEGVLRITYVNPMVSDPVMGIIHLPGGEYDSQGFRNPEILTQANIVAIGDSQTEGNNATSTQAWPLVLADITSTSVYSMAVEGYGPVQYDVLLSKALALHPKTVIVGFYLGNDLLDAEYMAYTQDAWAGLRNSSYVRLVATSTDPSQDFHTILGSGVEPGSPQYWILKIRMWIRAHSMLYALAGNATRNFREWIGVAETRDQKQDNIREIADTHPDIAYVYDVDPNLETVLSPTYRLDTVNLENPQTAEGWRITQDRFLDMQKLSSDAGIKLVIIIIPTKEKTYIEYMNKVGEKVPDSFTIYNSKETQLLNTVDTFCSNSGLLCFSALPDMANALAQGTAVYGTTDDGHPKASGYAVIAKSIFHYLSAHGLLP